VLQLLFALGNVQVALCPYFAWWQTSQPSILWAGFCRQVYFLLNLAIFELQLKLPLRAISQPSEQGSLNGAGFPLCLQQPGPRRQHKH